MRGIAALAVFAALLSAQPAKADSTKNDFQIYTQTMGTVSPTGGSSFTIWTFESGIPGVFQKSDQTYYPFTLEAVSHPQEPDVMEYLPTYLIATLCAPGQAGCQSETGTVHLTDLNGFVSGLPFECVGCKVKLQLQADRADSANKALDFLNNLPSDNHPVSSTPEPDSLLLMGTGVLGIALAGLRKLLA